MKQLPHTIQTFFLGLSLRPAQAVQFAHISFISLALVSGWHFIQPPTETHPSQQPSPYYKKVDITKQNDYKEAVKAIAKPVNQPVEIASVRKSVPKYASSDIGAGFARIKQCESGGNYAAVNSAGYYGAYQFGIGTWNSIASSIGRGDLVGVRPDKASPGDQDALAKALHSMRGWQPWGCAYHVGLL
ncbi:transglycosylase family protein [Candidatus Saccharibacteria bacterium]|jgi:hypothetical protein|nr:transglycosylase family protein [Candidatus Saccharibacteria bacterium]MBP9131977.1 transglycosylase family protein [Candidatus Saccharibacteria bacterium]